MIGGDGINDESNKMSPAPDTQIYLTKDTGFSPNAELANRMLVKAAEGFFGRMKVEAFYPEHQEERNRGEVLALVEEYIYWYNHERIKRSLGWMGPV